MFIGTENVKTLVLVSTLVTTITFAAGFAVPGGYNNSSGPQDDMATLGSKWSFQIFLICNIIATYSSIIVILALI
ncbi:unnamed protein product [Prunus armeniaca]|uniref:PGG domain-containing protein n=1 Tax=Prunus armeniaca TaxID=36596 RepID=A0A6J5WLW2_PRUAR|nr:unnamed protein product [Prunus armeniaca]CAB4300622.1 unnamed protein product [Prunus armeniaca]